MLRLIAILLLCLSHTAYPQSITSNVNTHTSKIGEVINYSITLKAPRQNNFIAPVLDSTFFEPLQIVHSTKADTTYTDDELTIYYTAYIAGYDSGLFLIPKPQLVVLNMQQDGILQTTLKADSQIVEIQNIPVNYNGDIKPIKSVNYSNINWYTIASAVLALAFLITCSILLYKWYKVYKQRKQLINYYTLSLGEIKAIDDNTLPKQAYTIITQALKNYWHHRLNIKCLQANSTQIMPLLQQSPFTKAQVSQMQALFANANLAKFAKVTIPSSQINMDATTAINLITQAEALYVQHLQQQQKSKNKK
jgi:hypothetical protein